MVLYDKQNGEAGKPPVTNQSDVFVLGLILFNMVMSLKMPVYTEAAAKDPFY